MMSGSLDRLRDFIDGQYNSPSVPEHEKAFYIYILRYIDRMPIIEPERKSAWIPVDSFHAFGGDEATWMAHGNPPAFHFCLACKKQAYVDEEGKDILSDFCPHCGADMRGE